MIGKRIKELREEQNLSQKELSEQIGIAQSSIGNYERGIRLPDSQTILSISKFFNVSTDYLLGASIYKSSFDEILSKELKQPFEALKEKFKSQEPIDCINQMEKMIDVIMNTNNVAVINESTKTLNTVLKLFSGILQWHYADSLISSLIDFGSLIGELDGLETDESPFAKLLLEFEQDSQEFYNIKKENSFSLAAKNIINKIEIELLKLVAILQSEKEKVSE